MTTFRIVVQVELALLIGLSVLSMVLLGWPWKSKDPAITWMLFVSLAMAIAESMVVLVLMVGVHVWPWSFAVLFGGFDIVAAWRLWLQR